jgi:hypothetical protein
MGVVLGQGAVILGVVLGSGAIIFSHSYAMANIFFLVTPVLYRKKVRVSF